MHALLILLISDVVVFLSHVGLGKKLGFFHLEKEGNLGSFQAGIKFWLAGTLSWISAWIIYHSSLKQKQRLALLLATIGTGLAYIGIDDMMAIHERLGFVINHLLGKGGFYGESFNWLLYFSPFAMLALGLFIALLIWVRKTDQLVFMLFLIGTLACVSSLGAEWLGGRMIVSANLDVERYRQLILIEEGLEMIGASFLTGALWNLTNKLITTFIRVEKSSSTT